MYKVPDDIRRSLAAMNITIEDDDRVNPENEVQVAAIYTHMLFKVGEERGIEAARQAFAIVRPHAFATFFGASWAIANTGAHRFFGETSEEHLALLLSLVTNGEELVKLMLRSGLIRCELEQHASAREIILLFLRVRPKPDDWIKELTGNDFSDFLSDVPNPLIMVGAFLEETNATWSEWYQAAEFLWDATSEGNDHRARELDPAYLVLHGICVRKMAELVKGKHRRLFRDIDSY